MPNEKEMTSQVSVKFFQQQKNLAYHIAYSLTHEDSRAEEVVREVMGILHECGVMDGEWTKEEKKAILALVTRHRALVAARANRSQQPMERHDDVAIPSLVGDAEVSVFGEQIARIPERDRIVLQLSILFSLSDEHIASLLRMKRSAVISRRTRALAFIGAENNLSSTQQQELSQFPSFVTALHLLLKSYINSVEAVSHLDTHIFAPEREEQILNDLQENILYHRAMNKVSRLRESQNRILLLVGAIMIAVILVFVVLQALGHSGEHRRFEIEESTLSSEQTSSSAEDVTEIRQVKRAHAAYYKDRILFLDEKSGILYEAKLGSPVRALLNLRDALTEAYGIEHIGYQDGRIYLAFVDGRGGHVDGNPPTLTMEEYWVESWFSQQEKAPAASKILVDGIEYQLQQGEN